MNEYTEKYVESIDDCDDLDIKKNDPLPRIETHFDLDLFFRSEKKDLPSDMVGDIHLSDIKDIEEVKTIIILDWDNTMLATTSLGVTITQLLDKYVITDYQKKYLHDTSIVIEKLITLLLTYGEINIITASEQGWVEETMRKFYPNIQHILSKIKIYSARSLYEKRYPDNPYLWKHKTFEDVLYPYIRKLGLRKNIISIGDSQCERQALLEVAKGKFNTVAKSVKLMDNPSYIHIKKQLEIIIQLSSFLVNSNSDADISISG